MTPEVKQSLIENVLPKLKQNTELLNELLKNPDKTIGKLNQVFGLGQGDNLLKTNVKIEFLGSALNKFDDLPLSKLGTVNKNDIMPNILSQFTPDELKSFIGHSRLGGDDFIKNNKFFQDLNLYFKNNVVVPEGSALKFIVTDSAGRQIGDYTDIINDMNRTFKDELLKSVNAPNPAREASLVDNGQNFVELQRKGLSNDNAKNLKNILDDATARGVDVPGTVRKTLDDVEINGNLFDQKSLETIRSNVLDLVEGYQKSYMKSIENLKDAFGNIDPDSLAMVNQIYDPIFKQFGDINTELETILNIPAAEKIKIVSINDVPTVEELKTITKKYNIKLEGSDELENTLKLNAENPEEVQKQIDSVKETIRKNKEKAELVAQKQFDEATEAYKQKFSEWEANNKDIADLTPEQQKTRIEELKAKRDELVAKRKENAEKLKRNQENIVEIERRNKVTIEHDNYSLSKSQPDDFKYNKDSKVDYPQMYRQNGRKKQKLTLSEPFQNRFFNGVEIKEFITQTDLQGKVKALDWTAVPDKSFDDEIAKIDFQIGRTVVDPPKAPVRPDVTWVDNMDIEVSLVERKFKIQNWESQVRPPGKIINEEIPTVRLEDHIPDTVIRVKAIELPDGYINKPVILNPTNDFEYTFTIIADPIEKSKKPLQSALKKAIRKPKPKIPKDTQITAQKFKDWLEPNLPPRNPPPTPPPIQPPLGPVFTNRVAKILNNYFKTNIFSKLKVIRYKDICDNTIDINSEFLLRESNTAQNFIDSIVEEIIFSKAKPEDYLRLKAYEDVFMDIFEFPIIFEKSQIDNRMLEILMEQRRRGIEIDLTYLKNYINYENLNIFNQLNYQYLFSDFKKVETLLIHQIGIIQKNYAIIV